MKDQFNINEYRKEKKEIIESSLYSSLKHYKKDDLIYEIYLKEKEEKNLKEELRRLKNYNQSLINELNSYRKDYKK